MWSMWAVGIVAPWPLVSRFSKNLLFDGMLYDIILFLSYAIALGLITNGFIKFNLPQWIGFSLIVCGFLIMKLYS